MANTIQDKLTYLSGTKDAIKQAIIGKGVEVTDTDTFRSYANKIEAIQAGGSIAGAPSGIKFGNSQFTTVPVEIIPYLEAQTNLAGIFMSCPNLSTVSLFDTSRATEMENMFNGCQSLVSVPAFDTKNVIDTHYMFSYCMSLKILPTFDTKNVKNMSGMFGYCSSLTTVPLLNFSNVTEISFIFDNCNSLTNLGGFTGLKSNLNLNSSSKLTVDSVMNIINNAADMTSSPRTLTLHQDVFAKLSQEQIATASAKGWNIADF